MHDVNSRSVGNDYLRCKEVAKHVRSNFDFSPVLTFEVILEIAEVLQVHRTGLLKARE